MFDLRNFWIQLLYRSTIRSLSILTDVAQNIGSIGFRINKTIFIFLIFTYSFFDYQYCSLYFFYQLFSLLFFTFHCLFSCQPINLISFYFIVKWGFYIMRNLWKFTARFWGVYELIFIFIYIYCWVIFLTFLTVIFWIYFLLIFSPSIILWSFELLRSFNKQLLLILYFAMVLWTKVFLFLNWIGFIDLFLQTLIWSLNFYLFIIIYDYFISLFLILSMVHFHSIFFLILFQLIILPTFNLQIIIYYLLSLGCLIFNNIVNLFFA